jgi:hypothetical protein
MENFYDLIVKVNEITKSDKWELKTNDEGRKRLSAENFKKTCIVGVVGNFNKGKTFFLSKISE